MPFSLHIVHAILINLVRLPRYALLSRGRSIIVSLGLIAFEVLILPLAFFYDLWAPLKFSKKSPSIMKDDFVSMKLTPLFKTSTTQIPHQDNFAWLTVKEWRININILLDENQWNKANKELEAIRKNLASEQKGSHFLCRHFLESVHLAVANTINWTKEYEDSVEEKKRFLSHRKLFIWWQAVGYEGAQTLDALAFNLHQKRSLPILINDVPPIPVPDTQK